MGSRRPAACRHDAAADGRTLTYWHNRPVSAEPWRVPEEWAVRVMHPAPPVETAPPALNWRRDSISGPLTPAYVALSGPALGLLMPATPPPLRTKPAVG